MPSYLCLLSRWSYLLSWSSYLSGYGLLRWHLYPRFHFWSLSAASCCLSSAPSCPAVLGALVHKVPFGRDALPVDPPLHLDISYSTFRSPCRWYFCWEVFPWPSMTQSRTPLMGSHRASYLILVLHLPVPWTISSLHDVDSRKSDWMCHRLSFWEAEPDAVGESRVPSEWGLMHRPYRPGVPQCPRCVSGNTDECLWCRSPNPYCDWFH